MSLKHSNDDREGDVIDGRWKLGPQLSGQGHEDCQDPRCTRMSIDGEDRCVGYHCAECGGSSSMYGHYTMVAWWEHDPMRAVKFPDGAGYFTCQPEFEQAVAALRAERELT